MRYHRLRTSRLLVIALWLALCPLVSAQSWFPPSTTWLAQRLRAAGCQTVRHDGKAVGGLLESGQPGPTVVFSSNDPAAAVEILRGLGKLDRGSVLAVFGSGVQLKRGDYLIKVEFTRDLRPGQVALPAAGPSVDTIELLIDEGEATLPAVVLASDLVLTLQNRARTASELVIVQMERYREQSGGQLAIDLSLRVFDPSLREQATAALEEISRERLALHGATLVSSKRQASTESGQWPQLRAALGDRIEVLQQEAPTTELSGEDFGRPHMPSITLRAGSADRPTLQALASTLILALKLDPRPELEPQPPAR
jgi:hypothetical protein